MASDRMARSMGRRSRWDDQRIVSGGTEATGKDTGLGGFYLLGREGQVFMLTTKYTKYTKERQGANPYL